MVDSGNRTLWTVHTTLDRSVFLKAADCLETAYTSLKESEPVGESVPCISCRLLEHNNIVSGICQTAAEGAHPNTPWRYLSAAQMISLLTQKNHQLNDLKLNALNLLRKIGTRNKHLQEWKRLPMMVSQGHIPRLQSLIATHHRAGRGIFSLLEKIDNAAKKKYSPKRYDDADFQRAFLFYRLGGRAVANLAHRTLGTPSIDQTKRKIKTVKLQSSPAFPTSAEVKANITACFPSENSSIVDSRRAPILGMSIQIDELKVSERLRYNAVDNTIIGVCREHGGRCNLKFNGIEQADALLECIKQKQVHFATEASFIGLSIFGKDSSSYIPRPIVISGSCKRETVTDHERLLQLCHDSVAEVLGPQRRRLYCISSDGDARRRQALVPLTMTRILPKTSAIYPLLGHLPLFNLRCGDDDLTCDFDTKHNLKRLRNTAIRAKGFSINGVQITRATLRLHLLQGGMPASTVDSVLAPNDKQDVVLMIKLLHSIAKLPPPSANDPPTAQSTRRTLQLLGRLYHYLLSSYMDVSLSLYQQLVYLSAAAHLLLVIYHEDKGNFIPVQTYHDIMTQIKNVYFCIAKTQVDNPEAQFFIILIGTDGLEHIFGKIRTMIGTDTNCDMEQLYDRADAARQCQYILDSNPTWGGIARRLQTKPLNVPTEELDSSLDHVSPRMWKGDVHVAGVDLGQCWEAGFKLAEEHLAEAKFPSPLPRMMKTRGYDILCPFGNSKVVLVEATLTAGERDETAEETETVADESPVAPTCEQIPDIMPNLEDVAATTGLPDDDTPSSPWITVNTRADGSGHGRRVHKASVLRLYSSPLTIADSKDRLKRVRGYSQYMETSTRPLLDALLDSGTTEHIDEDVARLSVLDPALTLVHTDERIYLAVFQVTGIRYDNSDVQEIPATHLHEPNVHINGQVMTLALIQGEHDETLGEWEWIAKFEAKGIFRDLDGSAVELVDPALACASQGKDIGADTYVFKTSDLQGIASLIYERVTSHEVRLPTVSLSTTFPYRSSNDEACFVCQTSADGLGVDDGRTCPYCQHVRIGDLSGPNLLKHMGVHIKNDPRVMYSESPCGFCLSTGSTCEIRLIRGRGTDHVLSIDMVNSRCPNLRAIRISNAATFTNGQPCTNHPLKCPLCPSTVVWKYNLQSHIKTKHPTATLAHYKTYFDFPDTEKRALEEIYKKKTRVAKKAAPVSVLKVSDAHSSRNALSTVSNSNLIGTVSTLSPTGDEASQDVIDDIYASSDEGTPIGGNSTGDLNVTLRQVVHVTPSSPDAAETLVVESEQHVNVIPVFPPRTDTRNVASRIILSDPGDYEHADTSGDGVAAADSTDTGPIGQSTVIVPPLEMNPVVEETGRGKRNKRKRVQEDAAPDDSEDITICHLPICGQDIRTDEMVRCSMPGCGLTFHISCKGLDAVPVGTWFCDEDCRTNAGVTKRQAKRHR